MKYELYSRTGFFTKEEIVKAIESGVEVYGTSYEKPEEVARNTGVTVKQVKDVGCYDGEDFEYKNNQFIEDDKLYVIEREDD